MTDPTIPPHGGTLVTRLVAASDPASARRRAERLPRLTLDAREIADLELIAVGAASPLTGFLGSADYRAVLDRMRLANGLVWPLPLTLAVDHALAERLGEEAALWDQDGRLWGTIKIAETFSRDPREEAARVYGTEDPAHPGVSYLLSRPTTLIAGEVTVFAMPDDLPFRERRLSPRALRDEIRSRGWRTVAGFQTRNPIHRAHEHLTKLALEWTDGLVIHPLVGETKGDDVPAAVRFRAYEALLKEYYPAGRTLLAAFPAAMRYAGPREAIFHALVRKNYGITHLIVGRDHAGVGNFYDPLAAQQIFDSFGPGEIGVTPLKFEAAFYCEACDGLATERTCPHPAAARLALSGTRVREILRTGGHLPTAFTRPEIAEILRSHYVAGGSAGPASPDRPPSPDRPEATAVPRHHDPASAGFIVWFTGLPGAGKSTLAGILRERLAPGRRVEVLDGDEVRTYLSKGLGFSKEDRDQNIRRIGYVARVLARNGVVTIGAAISPYAATRDEVRALAKDDGVRFVEIHADAELDALVRRDPKGLYRRALAGEIQHFTGVSDPYEPPARPEVVVRTDLESVEESVQKIWTFLIGEGLVPAPAPTAANVGRDQGAEPAVERVGAASGGRS
jgi:sulfate adenylyltransferase